MRPVFHPKVFSEIDQIIDHYEQTAPPELAGEFYAELRHFILKASENPHTFSVRQNELRRVNLRRFPYHFLFRIANETVRILVVRHHHKHPSFGVARR